MDFSPLVSESHPHRYATRAGLETHGEKNPSHMENHTKCISSFMMIVAVALMHVKLRQQCVYL